MDKIDKFDGEYAFLSNFYPSNIYHDGICYPTVEHAFQAAKTMNLDERMKIANLETPGKAKRAGRQVALRSDWENVKYEIMKELVTIKFINPSLRKLLLETKSYELIEGNDWNDTCWGVCNGIGQNNLGKILMQVREDLK